MLRSKTELQAAEGWDIQGGTGSSWNHRGPAVYDPRETSNSPPKTSGTALGCFYTEGKGRVSGDDKHSQIHNNNLNNNLVTQFEY